jgi:hypothetical protein
MDHSRVPGLEALQEFRRRGDVVYGPPGHKQGLGADPRVVDIVGEGVFASDVLSLNGLDDRQESQGVLSQAQELMADAVGAEQAFFSTCGDGPSRRRPTSAPRASAARTTSPSPRAVATLGLLADRIAAVETAIIRAHGPQRVG